MTRKEAEEQLRAEKNEIRQAFIDDAAKLVNAALFRGVPFGRVQAANLALDSAEALWAERERRRNQGLKGGR